MSIEKLVEVIQAGFQADWKQRNDEAASALLGAGGGRYPASAEKAFTLRAPGMDPESGVPYAAYIHPSNPTSGPYSGLSFVLFPVANEPCLVGLGIGTQGLSPDEAILGRPGHARKAQAICAWINREFGDGKQIAWAKQDPTRTDITIPADFEQQWPSYEGVFKRYGNVMYAIFAPGSDSHVTSEAVTALLDLFFEERGIGPLAAFKDDRDRVRAKWFEYLMPTLEKGEVRDLLEARKYVIVQGPPGTGKTRMATKLLEEDYGGCGRSIQFHPNTTYESFIGGLAPVQSTDQLGLQFRPKPGFLMEAAAQAAASPSMPYLLHVDEINRADLSKILGEAIYLLEVKTDTPRKISLPYQFGEPFQDRLSLPANLHILGTMNSADRSIAIVDVAVRRRFAFVSLWPQMSVVEEFGCKLTQEAYRRLVSIFIEHAGDDAFNLVPGHSYFLESDEERAKQDLQVSLVPLLDEYLAQGYVSGFAEPIRGYLQWLRSL